MTDNQSGRSDVALLRVRLAAAYQALYALPRVTPAHKLADVMQQEACLKQEIAALERQIAAANEAIGETEQEAGAYVPASQLWREKFRTYKQFKAWLRKIPETEIRRRKPRVNRLLIHAGDWARYWAKKDEEGWQNMDRYLTEAEKRKAKVRQTKRRKTKRRQTPET